MPKRVIDGDAVWGSTKLSECPEWTIPFYTWLYPLADANGSFELTNPRVIWCKVAAILPNFSPDTLTEIIRIFEEHGLLFIWSENGKRYAHWTGSEKPGRLPQPARRKVRYGPLLAPPVPTEQLQHYQLRQQKCRTATAEVSPVLVLDWFRKGIGMEETPPPAPAAPGVCERLVTIWNAKRGALPEVLELTDKRRQAINSHIRRDLDFPKKFETAVGIATDTPFLCGTSSGSKGWRADFDWMLAADNLTKVLEDRYRQGNGGQTCADTLTDDNCVTAKLRAN